MNQNSKLDKSNITDCPEIEEDLPCQYFNKVESLCKSCYAKDLWPIRKSVYKGKRKTQPNKLIRLGTWKEITWLDYIKFKKLFPNREYFLISRGFQKEIYNEMLLDKLALNIQISVDIHDDSRIVPPFEILEKLKLNRKILFRFKTEPHNVQEFISLARALNISGERILETPQRYRQKHSSHKLGNVTPFELNSFKTLSCNSKCIDCAVKNKTKVNICSFDLNI